LRRMRSDRLSVEQSAGTEGADDRPRRNFLKAHQPQTASR
jgi:hypothetical protein